MENKGISAIICCYNSAERLPETIKYIASQVVSLGISWELIIVNNKSTDDTADVALAEIRKYKTLVNRHQIIDESEAGLSYARQRGIAKSNFEYIIFCDDDNWLEENYFQSVYDILSENLEIGALGGINTPYTTIELPDWFNHFSHSFAVGKSGKGALEILDKKSYVVGAGMAVRNSALEILKNKGFRHFLKDRVGNKTIGGGDVELCLQLSLCGYQIAHSDDLKLVHYIPSNRLTLRYLRNMWHSYPNSWIIFDAYYFAICNKIKSNPSNLYWIKFYGKKLIKSLITLPRYINSKLKNDIGSYLPLEVNFLYAIYGLWNHMLVSKILKRLNSLHYHE